MVILGIESSCDETACAIVENGVYAHSSVVASSKDLHEKTGGVVPEVAARRQIECVIPVISEALSEFSGGLDSIDSLAVTVGPGLIGSLIVGVETAKMLSLVWDKPLVGVNHLVGHIYANFLASSDTGDIPIIEFPAIVLLVSGGHTDLVLMRGHGDFEFIGGTLDDAAGEAFDKTARLLGLAKYLGGVELSKTAATCTENTFSGVLPRPMIKEPGYDFSFSGLKTAVRRLVEKQTVLDSTTIASISCEFETAVVDVLTAKTFKAVENYAVKSLLLGGGVSANTPLRARMRILAEEHNIALHVPPLNLCTDNAVYIASAAYFNYSPMKSFEDIQANPSLGIVDVAV
jgi:N6-L-threonylcarbamoyladenine synthase